MMKDIKKTPNLRFPGFTDNWEQYKLKKLIRKPVSDGPHETPQLIESGIPFLSVEAIHDGIVDISKCRGFISQEDDNRYKKKYTPEIGDIFFTKAATIGRVAIVEELGFNIWSPIGAIKPNAQLILPKYLYYALQTEFIQKFAMREANSGTQRNLAMDKIEEFLIPTPKQIKEQKTISEFLTCIDSILTLHQRKCDELKMLKKGMLQKMFPKDGENVPEIRFLGFTDDWEQRKLDDVAKFSKGNGYSKGDLVDNGTPIILYGRLYTKYETTIKKVDTFVMPKNGSVYSKGGEVIVPASGETAEDIARASSVENAGVLLGGDLNIIMPDKDINSTFLALSISNGHSQRELAKKAQGKSVVHIHNGEIKSLEIPFPEKLEQDKIAYYFERLDNLITLHQRKCDELIELKKGLLQQMFI